MRLLCIVVFLMITGNLFSQNYMQSAGFRGGNRPSVTYRMFINDEDAYEFYFSAIPGGTSVSALKQKCKPLIWGRTDNLYFVYGFGAHVGLYYTNHYTLFTTKIYLDSRRLAPLFGVDGYFGVEYRVRELPFAFGLDATPFFEFSTIKFFNINILNTAFTIKYRF